MRPILPIIAFLSLVLPARAQDRPQAERKPPDCAALQGALPKTWEGQAYAIDGDTIAGVGLKPPIRLWGIRAPELRGADKGESVSGMRARAALEDLLAAADHRVSCQAANWDRDCRVVAQCTITAEMPVGTKPAPHDVALRLLEDGMAYAFHLEAALPWDREASGRYAHFEAISRQAGKGLWPVWLDERESGRSGK
jgi:endonuclease YncB( thermonuclease family)